LANPDFRTESYLPSSLLEWSDYYYNLRTAVPFVGIGFLLEVNSPKHNLRGKPSSRAWFFIQNRTVSVTIVCLAEAGQFFIKYRNPDFMNVFFGLAGSGLGSLGYYIVSTLMNFKSKRNAK
jgi:glycopeptide antibiotics resistance protein